MGGLNPGQVEDDEVEDVGRGDDELDEINQRSSFVHLPLLNLSSTIPCPQSHISNGIMKRTAFVCTISLLVLQVSSFQIELPNSISQTLRRSLHRENHQPLIRDDSSYRRNPQSSTGLGSTVRPSACEARRKELLTRRGPYFKLNKENGDIEFGATANLVTQLDDEPNLERISTWLKDERGLALSIWDEKLTTKKGDSVYRLQIMTLQFVTLQLAPWVDIEMKTLMGTNKKPVFCLQSVDFDPNIQFLPGMRFSAESLGIVIEVAGQLLPTNDEKGVVGAIAFQTTGNLPPPLRILPESALKKAADTINDTIVKFAIASFQKGATAKYNEFRQVAQLR